MDAFLEILWKLLAVTVLVLLNGFFVAAEFALVKVRDTQLAPLIARGHRRARIARRVIGNLDASLSACQLGITLASLGLGWIGEPVFAALLRPLLVDVLAIQSVDLRETIAFIVGFSVLTFLHISAGEQGPKWLAIQRPLPTALWVVRPLEWFHRASYPFIWLLNRASLWLLQLVGLQTGGEAQPHSEEELRLLFTATHQKSGGSALGRDVVLNALELRHRVVREVMRPRKEIVALDTDATIAQCLDLAERTRYSRFPICPGGDLDQTLGVVHIKDLYALRIRARTGADLVPAARKLIYVPPTARLEKLLQLFLERKLHLAMVVDEYGGTIGMVTLENILEELVGQIQDEFDQEKPLLARQDEQTWELDGALPLHQLAELIGEPLHEEGITTTSGWITQRVGGFPKVGDVLVLDRCELRVEEVDGMRVARIRLVRRPTADLGPASEA